MKLKIIKIRNPRGYFFTKLSFSKPETAEKYVDSLNNKFLLRKTQMQIGRAHV